MRKIEQLVSGKEDEKLQAKKVETTIGRVERRFADYESTIDELIDDENQRISDQEELLSTNPSEFDIEVIDTALATIEMLKARKVSITKYRTELFSEVK